ncbi:MAG: reverse transcriptase domain-containing protein [bacterium]
MLTIDNAHRIIRSIYGKPERFFSFPDHKDFLSLKDEYLTDKVIDPLSSGDYEFYPFISFRVPKENGKHRTVYQSATLKDELVLIYLHQYLLEKTGPMLPDYVIGYRKKKDNPAGILRAIRSAIAFSDNRLGEWAIKADIKSFYDSINKEKMSQMVDNARKECDLDKNIVRTIKRLINFSGPGLPTGLSPVNDLANLYLLPFDRNMNQKTICYYRYGDDIILIGKNNPEPIMGTITKELSDQELTLSSEKTKLLSPRDGFDYIGFYFKNGNINFKEATIKRIKRRLLSIMNKLAYRKLSLNCIGDNRYLFSFFFYEINNLLTESPIKSRMKYFVLVGNDYPFTKIDDWLVSHIRHKITGSWSGRAIRQAPYRLFHNFGFISSHCLFHRMEKAHLLRKNFFDRLFSPKELEQSFIHYFRPSTTSPLWKEYFVNRKENSIRLSELLKNKQISFSETHLNGHSVKPIISHSINEKIALRATHLYLKKILYPQLLMANDCVYSKVGSAIRLMRLFNKNRDNYRLLRIDLGRVHERLDRRIIREILQSVSVNRNIEQIIGSLFNRLLETNIAGLPRGTPINNILVETYLSLIDSYIKPLSAMFVRTADDFLIIYDKNNKNFITQFALYLQKLNMAWDEKRYSNINNDENFSVEYLGYSFQKKDGQPLLITIDQYNIAQFKKKIVKLTKRNKKRTLRQIINYINRLIYALNQQYSFIRYYSRINDFRLLNQLDDYICDRIRVAVYKRFHLRDRRRLTNDELHNNHGLANLVRITLNTKKIIARRRVLGYIGNTDPRFAPTARALKT